MPAQRVIQTVTKYPGVTDEKGTIIMAGPDLKTMPYKNLVDIAKALGGEVISVMYETQHVLKTRVCSARDCYKSPSNGQDRCMGHKLGGKS